MIQIREVAVGYDKIGYTIERLRDGQWWNGTAFVAVSATVSKPDPIALTVGTENYLSAFTADIPADPAIFPPGFYTVYIHRMDNKQAIGARTLDYNVNGVYLIGGATGGR